jgi:predicted Abi (CAAX) family protease
MKFNLPPFALGLQILMFPLLVSATGCQPRVFNAAKNQSANTAKKYISIGDFLEPNDGAWTGRLIMPTPQERRPDGGVWLEVYNSPRKIKNPPQRVWLKLDATDPKARSFMLRTRLKISIDKANEVATSPNKYPRRLDGLEQLSPLETLAGARPDDVQDLIGENKTSDSIEVLIRKGGLDEQGDLVTRTDPMQIVGREVALIKFISPIANNDDEYQIKHYSGANSSSGFEGESETVALLPVAQRQQFRSTISIHESPLNEYGWYAYGERVKGVFQIRALEPREIMSTKLKSFRSEANFISRHNFENIKANKGTGSVTTVAKTQPEKLERGDRGLVIHLFGGIGGEKGDNPPKTPLTQRTFSSGHFAYGIGRVIKDSFTDEDRIDIEYKQVYAHNENAIVSGSNHWHSYSGGLKRGWMYSRPISDVFILHPQLNTPAKSLGFDPLEEIAFELDVMAARYRSGDGTGVAAVTSVTSCAQDSNQALFLAVKNGLKNLSERVPQTQGQEVASLVALMTQYKNELIGWAAYRKDWQLDTERNNNLIIKEPVPSKITVDQIATMIMSRNFLVPRSAHDGVAELFYSQNASLRFIRTNQIGGSNPEIFPLEPGLN